MTSLKIQYANEIAESMAKSLGSEEFTKIFKTASIEKEAGVALETFKKDVDVAVSKGTDLELVYTKHLGALQKEENAEPGTINKARAYMAEKARGKQPGMAYPEADDECCSMDSDDKMDVAADFALEHLVKVADALDNKGFVEFAEIIDEALQKVAKKAKKHRGRSYSQWVKFFGEKGEKWQEKFSKTFKGALEYAKKKEGLKGEKAEEYAMRVALDKMPEKFFKEPGPEHGPEKSGPLTKKKS